jgi:radical SAM protein with 4Fe4S-binding SPASM domain
MIIRPDLNVSLCCNDPLGKNTMGNVQQETLYNIWYGVEFQKVRDALLKGRGQWPHCKYCDYFNMG